MTGPTALVSVIDDDDAVRDSLRWMLEAHGMQVATFADAETFLQAPRNSIGGCVVADVRMPGMSGLVLQQRLAQRGDTLPMVLISGHADVPMAVEAMRAGAADFLEKPFTDEQLLRAVERALTLPRTGGPQGTQPGPPADPAARERLDRLSQRERQVLDLVVAGRLNKQIADDLSISIKTVEAHRANIMEKLGVRSMAELMKVALRGGAG
jgi:two-component system response regulator TtrR